MGTLGNSLLEEHRRQVTPTPPRDVTRRTGEQIDLLLDDPVIEPDEIRAGLALLRANPRLGPSTLPSLVNQVRQEAAHPELAARASPRQQSDNAQLQRALERARTREGAT